MVLEAIGKHWAGSGVLVLMISVASLVLSGCSGGGGDGGTGGREATGGREGPALQVTDTRVSFGGVAVNQVAERPLAIHNQGQQNLQLGPIARTSALASPYTLLSDGCSGRTLLPADSCQVAIRFAPTTQAEYVDRFVIPSNDPDAPAVTVEVHGTGLALDVTITGVSTEPCAARTVQLVVTVTDQEGQPVLGLAAEHFALLEQGTPKALTGFANTQRSPIAVGLVLDYSSSTTPYTAAIEQAATVFVDELDPSQDEVEVIKFARVAYTLLAFTTDKTAIKGAIAMPYPDSRRGTALYDTLVTALEHAAQRPRERRAVICRVGWGGWRFRPHPRGRHHPCAGPRGAPLSHRDRDGARRHAAALGARDRRAVFHGPRAGGSRSNLPHACQYVFASLHPGL
jgi:hypothetical protein